MVKTKQVLEMLPKRDFAKETFWLGSLAFLLAVSISVAPTPGVILSSLTPVPLIIIFYFWGANYGLVVTGIILAAISILAGMHIGTLFVVQYGIMAFIIGESLRINQPLGKTFFLATTVPLAIGFVLLFIFLARMDVSLISFMEKVINTNIDSTVNMYKEMGVKEQQIELMQSEAKKLNWILISALPALIMIGSFFSIIMNYFLARLIMLKRYGVNLPAIKPVSKLLIPDIYVWLLIVGGVSMMMGIQPLKFIGINLLIIMVLAYCVQGMGVVSQFSEKWKAPNFVKLFIYIIIFSQPFSLILVTFIGLFDIWLDFRKLRVKESESVS